MTITEFHPIRKVVVVGSTFGQLYLEALHRCRPGITVTGLLSRGSERSRRIAEAHGVPLMTRIEDVPDDTDLACVIVRSNGIGGSGTTIAAQLLERGIAVLHELPVGKKDVATCLRAAHRGGARFAVADLYRWLPAVRAFRGAARELLAVDRPLAIDAHLSIQPAYTLARLFTEIGLSTRPVSLQSSQDGTLIGGTLGGVPVAVRYATVLDARDTDNDVRFPSMFIHTRSGTLTLADVHGPVHWTPTLHLPEQAKTGAGYKDDNLNATFSSVELFQLQNTHAQILTDLWPRALAEQITAMSCGMSNGDAQRILQVAQLWESLTGGVEFPAAGGEETDGMKRMHIQERLRAAARAAINEAHPSKEKEDENLQ